VKQSAGTLLYRQTEGGLRVLLVCPSGVAARFGWCIPKWIIDEGETPEAAARRETLEETGVAPGALHYLGEIRYQKSRKRVHCFAGPAPETEPRLSSWEISAARFVSPDEARRLLHPDQRPFVDRLEALLARG
jgi:predicted NUDIX family NTP pyrophosphohydrolase